MLRRRLASAVDDEAASTSLISTFTYTADRDTRIDFSRPYYKATGRLLVKTNSPIATLNDIRGKRVATTSGSIYDRWMKRCFTDTTVVVIDSVTNAVIAFNQGRADAVMWDDSALATLAANRRRSSPGISSSKARTESASSRATSNSSDGWTRASTS